jgi:hypothetical protein
VISIDNIGTLPVKILPHAASKWRGVRLGLGTVEYMLFLDARSGQRAAFIFLPKVTRLMLQKVDALKQATQTGVIGSLVFAYRPF